MSKERKSEKKSVMPQMAKKKELKQLTMREHAREREMWVGSKAPQTIETYLLRDNKFVLEKVFYPPALLKIIDEILVNALDHYVSYPNEVKEVRLSVDEKGYIEVYNDGPGIEISKKKNIQDKEMYSPQFIFAEFLTGTNFDDTQERVVGGQNGVGAKIAVVFSIIFTVETLDKVTNQLYKQNFLDTLLSISEPEIKSVPPNRKSYTKIRFLPNYSDFSIDINEFLPTLKALLEVRMWQAAAYTPIKISYNGSVIPYKNFKTYCEMFSNVPVYYTKLQGPDGKMPWEVCFAISDGKSRDVSIVNGIFLPRGGTHINHLQNLLTKAIQTKIDKIVKKIQVKFNKNNISNNMFLFMCGPIPSPTFSSQTKEALCNPIEKFASYDFSTKDYNSIWTMMEPVLMDILEKKQTGEVKTRANRTKVDVAKYVEAKYCRDAKLCQYCGLIITEGDSASGTVNTGLLSGASDKYTYDYYGIFSTGGVPINGLKQSVDLSVAIKQKKTTKEISELDDIDTDENKEFDEMSNPEIKFPDRKFPNERLKKNERLSSLMKVLGLDYNKKYELSPVGDKEFKTLRYGFVIGMMDQDLDGFNIFGLIATFFMTYWPALIQRGYLRRAITPIIRAYPKKKPPATKNSRSAKVSEEYRVYEFYSEKEASQWLESKTEEQRNNFKLEYYKGLGTHDEQKKEITQIFKKFDKNIRIYHLTPDSFKDLEIFYGNETNPRKKMLADPSILEHSEHNNIPINEHFKIDTKLYQRNNLLRKLSSMVDGLVDSRRKILMVARKNGHNKIKVQGLAGMAVAEANYHHGEVSLEQTIIKMAQAYPMARNLPLLIPIGNFGSRSKGYKDSAASRYIYTHVNYRLVDKLFRKEDDYILKYDLDDGNRYEPKYYVPIIPYVLCENGEIPATGWKMVIHARNVFSILANTRAMITGKITKCGKLPIWTNNFKGNVVEINGRWYYTGLFEYNEITNTLHITELPSGLFSDIYLRGTDADSRTDKKKSGIQALPVVEDFEDRTTNQNVNISIKLKVGAMTEIMAKYPHLNQDDAILNYFQLKLAIQNDINLINANGEVICYKNYEDVFNDWFVFRKELYEKRIEREIILIDYEIKMLQNMQRFTEKHASYEIKKLSEDQFCELLAAEKYEIFNSAMINNPKYTEIKELINMITKAKFGATYKYITDARYNEFTETGVKKRNKRIAELQERRNYLIDDTGAFPGAKIWLLELDELEKAIKFGLETNWTYGENDYVFQD